MKIKKFLKQIILGIIILFFGISILSLTVKAENNKWVLDELNVISDDTKDYIQNLNENVFPNYKNKPQLGIIVISEMPENYTMDEYKLEMFNHYGVGTKQENCGLLFILSINDRKYGLEIGNGFEKGSLLRADLETDFITSDMKDLLQLENYDAVIFEVTKHLENIMFDEENGIYQQKEEQKMIENEQFEKNMKKNIIIFFKGFGCLTVFIFIFIIIYYFKKKSLFNKLLKENESYFHLMSVNIEDIKASFWDFCCSNSIYDLRNSFITMIYEFYIENSKIFLEQKSLKHNKKYYFEELEKTNSEKNFKNKNLVSLEDIIFTVDKKFEEKEKITIKNYEKINIFISKNKHRINNPNIAPLTLEKAMKNHVLDSKELSENELEKIFVQDLKDLNFEEEYKEFIKANKDKINEKYFDANKFKKELKKSSEFTDYHYHSNNNYIWMTALLTSHLLYNEKQVKAEEKRKEEARKKAEEENNSNNFGGGFGGGYSSGGGFSGGW